MGRPTIRKEDPWTLAPGEPDVRGWQVQDPSGKVLGHVEDIETEPDGQHIYAIVLTSGRQFRPHQFHVQDDVVVVDENLTAGAPPGEAAEGHHRAGRSVADTGQTTTTQGRPQDR